VKVYSTIPRAGQAVRDCGKDAIRVVVTFASETSSDKPYGVYKAKRVHRTGSVEAVVERMLSRMREAYGFINGRLNQKKVA
jgi:hypothetical protein